MSDIKAIRAERSAKAQTSCKYVDQRKRYLQKCDEANVKKLREELAYIRSSAMNQDIDRASRELERKTKADRKLEKVEIQSLRAEIGRQARLMAQEEQEGYLRSLLEKQAGQEALRLHDEAALTNPATFDDYESAILKRTSRKGAQKFQNQLLLFSRIRRR